jgi:hypothetical protein
VLQLLQARRALEHQVLEQVREPGPPLRLGPDPDVVVHRDADDGGTPVGSEQDPQAVVERGADQRVRRRGQRSGSWHALDITGRDRAAAPPPASSRGPVPPEIRLCQRRYDPAVEGEDGGDTGHWWAFVDEAIWIPPTGTGCTCSPRPSSIAGAGDEYLEALSGRVEVHDLRL